jgi:hypothetical protein
MILRTLSADLFRSPQHALTADAEWHQRHAALDARTAELANAQVHMVECILIHYDALKSDPIFAFEYAQK